MAGQMTIDDIANALGVSKSTVSRAISGKGRIGQNTKARVLAYIEEHNYKPNVVAQGLAQSKTFNIGVVLPNDYILVDMPFFLNCLEGIYQIASANNHDIVWTMCDNRDISALERIISNQKVDGVILMRTYVEDHAVRYLKEKGVPFVTIGSTTEEDVVCIDEDHEGGCKELTSILLMKGMRNIALIGGNEEYIVTQKRMQGFLNAHEDLHIPVRYDLIYRNMDKTVVVEKAVEDLQEKKAECIVCMDDSICGKVLNKLHKDGRQVPEDIKIASFFNSTILENSVPAITSLNFNIKDFGMTACQMLLDIMDGKTVQKNTYMDYQVVLKESTK